jgi:hypothetical protein
VGSRTRADNYCEALPGNGSVNTLKYATIEEAVFSVWSAPRNSMGTVFSVRGPCRDDIREYGNRNSVQVSVGDTHGKLEIEETLEVSLRRLSV